MPYTLDDIHLLLFDKDLLSPDDLIFGEYDVTTINRRNRNLQITTSKNNYLVKQVQKKESENGKTLTNELLFYKYVKEHMPHISSLFPEVWFADEESVTLILNFYRDAVPLWRYYKDRCPDNFPVKTAEATGRLLANFHNAFSRLDKTSLPFLSADLPFIFDLNKPHPCILSFYAKGGYQLLESIQQDEKLVEIWETATSLWQNNSLIHGDIKLDNVIVIPEGDDNETDNVKLVDWEMLQYGDAAFDIGGALQDYIFLWLIQMPDKDTAEEMIKGAPFAFSVFHPAIKAYWKGYSNICHAFGTEQVLKRSVLFSGLRCIQTSFEISNKFDHMPGIASILFNMGASIMKDPAKAQSLLFGLN